jgi:AraC-like DNA-binding protein
VTGFYDQSHLTRHFRKLVGVTPGRYSRDRGRRGH